jgi:hypothetical protein
MHDESDLTLQQLDRARGDLYALHDELDSIKHQLARLPTRNEVWRAALRRCTPLVQVTLMSAILPSLPSVIVVCFARLLNASKSAI